MKKGEVNVKLISAPEEEQDLLQPKLTDVESLMNGTSMPIICYL